MVELIILGASNAIPTQGSENTHLAILSGSQTVLVDCVSTPVRLEQAGIDIQSVNDIILTHFHPDHVGGLPLFLMDMWLLGRKHPLNIYGLHYTLDRAETMMGLYGWSEWPNFFTVNFCRLPADEMATVLQTPEMDIYCSPVKHFLPNIGLRVEIKAESKVLAYSSDTEPCQAVVQLAQDADVLLHEASGPFKGHTSAAQAGEIASKAGAKSLYLIHYPTGRFASGDLVAEAREKFPGEVALAHDLQHIQLI